LKNYKKIKIACIGWGSLIWNPENLACQNKWFEDGPLLPIEFTRISGNNRVTLIIDKNSSPVRTLWSLMLHSNLDDCINSLMTREGTTKENIHYTSANDTCEDKFESLIKKWLLEKHIDLAIWTGLSFSKKTNSKRPTVVEIIKHLEQLTGTERSIAEEYIRLAPRQIDTEYRREIENKLGWKYLQGK